MRRAFPLVLGISVPELLLVAGRRARSFPAGISPHKVTSSLAVPHSTIHVPTVPTVPHVLSTLTHQLIYKLLLLIRSLTNSQPTSLRPSHSVVRLRVVTCSIETQAPLAFFPLFLLPLPFQRGVTHKPSVLKSPTHFSLDVNSKRRKIARNELEKGKRE